MEGLFSSLFLISVLWHKVYRCLLKLSWLLCQSRLVLGVLALEKEIGVTWFGVGGALLNHVFPRSWPSLGRCALQCAGAESRGRSAASGQLEEQVEGRCTAGLSL